MTIKCALKHFELRVTNAYGPQEYDSEDKKNHFWRYLDEEILDCQVNGSLCMILMDANAWVGKKLLKRDVHSQNKNGLMFENFMTRNSHLQLLNNMDICEDLITRSRNVNNRLEQSIIDFVVICDKLLPFTKKLLIDENKSYSLTNYSRRKKITHSDHNSLILEIDLKIKPVKIDRKIIFNYRDEGSFLKFKKLHLRPNFLKVFF